MTYDSRGGNVRIRARVFRPNGFKNPVVTVKLNRTLTARSP